MQADTWRAISGSQGLCRACRRGANLTQSHAQALLRGQALTIQLLQIPDKYADKGLHCRLAPGEHPVAGEGLWGTQREVPSFLYAMPVSDRRVFLEETCLVAKPPLPFSVLKRRLERRVSAMGLKVRWLISCPCLLCTYLILS